MTVYQQQAEAQLAMYERGAIEYILGNLERRYHNEDKKVNQRHLAYHFYFELTHATHSKETAIYWVREFFGEELGEEISCNIPFSDIWESKSFGE